jgi:hypothetical protein
MSSLKNIMLGMGSVMDIYPVRNKYVIPDYHPMRTDFEALQKDWEKVGNTLCMLINKEEYNVFQASNNI